MAEAVELYLDTSGVYHTDAEVAQKAQDILNDVGGEKEAIEDLSSLVKFAAQSGKSKYWERLSRLANNNTLPKSNRVNGVEMFKDIFNRDFSTIWQLAISIAEHRYELPVDIEWQKESDRSTNHINTETFTYNIGSESIMKHPYAIEPKGILDEVDYMRIGNGSDFKERYDVRKHPTESNIMVRPVDTMGNISDDVVATFAFSDETNRSPNFNLGVYSIFLTFMENGGGLARPVSAVVDFEPEA